MAFTVTAADMVARYDARTLGDLVNDAGTREAATELTASPVLTVCISEAMGIVKGTLLRANRYTSDELDTLTGDSLAFLVGIVCQLAWWHLWRRKPAAGDQDPQREEAAKLYETTIKRLNQGEVVLDLEPQLNAGLPTATSPDATTIKNYNLFSERPAGHFYPKRRFPR